MCRPVRHFIRREKVMEKFDVIIVGGGLAGTAAALTLAKAGKDVLCIERGINCGSKNVTGGRLYGHSLEKLIPGFAKEAPVERKVVKEKISLLTEDSGMTLEYASRGLGDEACASYTVLRGKFDKWFAAQAEKAGAMYVNGITVDALITENGKVVGVRSHDDEVFADAVILCDGVNSLLAQQAGLKKELKASDTAVGIKEVIQFDEKTVNERFGLAPGEGACWMVDGDPTNGAMGGGFIYTNKDSVSVGIVATISDIGYTDTAVPDYLERFKAHPAIAPYLEGGKVIEYSAHLVSEAGLEAVSELYGDGVLVAGDAAGFVINYGYTVRGMDFAIESGRLAAEAVLACGGDTSKTGLSVYRELLENSFVMKDLKCSKNMPGLLSMREMYTNLPKLTCGIMDAMFKVDGEQNDGLLCKAAPEIAKAGGLLTLTKVGMKALEAF